MSETLTALASENLNPSLRSLLEDVQHGHIRVPRFQRAFVWTDAQRLELLRSIRDNMPIGSLLVWRTIRLKLACFPFVGPYAIPPIADKPPATGWQYILDGHQRVSTLLSLLPPPTPSDEVEQTSDEDYVDWDIRYDLQEEDFVFAGRGRRKGAARPLLPLSCLLDGRLVIRHMREMRKQSVSAGWTDEDMNTWDERADQLSYRFQQYRIPIVVMVTDDLRLATRSFERINVSGTPMDEADLVAALTWSPEFDLRERLDELRLAFPPGWREIDDSLFLQTCKGLAELDMAKAGQTELVKKLQEDPTLLPRAGDGLVRVVNMLSERAAVVREELLPYALQLVLLAVELDRWKGAPHPGDIFLRWFWRTCWSEIFASATIRQVQAEQAHLRDASDGKTLTSWTRDQDLPARFDFLSARVRLFTLRLATRSMLANVDGQPVDGRALLMAHGRPALVRLFPVPRRASARLKKLLQGAGNRFFIDPGSATELRERLRNGPDLTVDTLKAHFVDEVGLAALRAGNLEEFIARRAAAMNEWDLAEWEAERQAAGDAVSP